MKRIILLVLFSLLAAAFLAAQQPSAVSPSPPNAAADRASEFSLGYLYQGG